MGNEYFTLSYAFSDCNREIIFYDEMLGHELRFTLFYELNYMCFFFHIAANTRSDTNIILSSMLLVAVLCLMVINGLLYYKLWGLEEAAAYTIMDLHVLKYILSISFMYVDIILFYICVINVF